MADRSSTQSSVDRSVIADGTFIRGRVTGSGNLDIAGRIEGDVAVTGEVLVDVRGLVSASITAQNIVIRGAVRGDLVAEDAVRIEPGARVVGNLRAPRVAIAPGGLVRGYVETTAPAVPRAQAVAAARVDTRFEPSGRASSPPIATAMASPAPLPLRAISPPLAVRAPAPPPAIRADRVDRAEPKPAAQPQAFQRASLGSPEPETNGASSSDTSEPPAFVLSSPGSALSASSANATSERTNGPPPPVVPVLKKGSKAVLNAKKRG